MCSCVSTLAGYSADRPSRRSAGLKRHLMSDPVHMMTAILPKYAVLQVVGYIKGKSAIHLARVMRYMMRM